MEVDLVQQHLPSHTTAASKSIEAFMSGMIEIEQEVWVDEGASSQVLGYWLSWDDDRPM